MTRAPVLEGTVQPGFERVADAFLANFTEHGDVGAACCIHVGGEPVIDAFADPARDLSFAYVMNQMRFSVTEPDPRAQGLVGATYAALDR